jgi:hypothetical protein
MLPVGCYRPDQPAANRERGADEEAEEEEAGEEGKRGKQQSRRWVGRVVTKYSTTVSLLESGAYLRQYD